MGTRLLDRFGWSCWAILALVFLREYFHSTFPLSLNAVFMASALIAIFTIFGWSARLFGYLKKALFRALRLEAAETGSEKHSAKAAGPRDGFFQKTGPGSGKAFWILLSGITVLILKAGAAAFFGYFLATVLFEPDQNRQGFFVLMPLLSLAVLYVFPFILNSPYSPYSDRNDFREASADEALLQGIIKALSGNQSFVYRYILFGGWFSFLLFMSILIIAVVGRFNPEKGAVDLWQIFLPPLLLGLILSLKSDDAERQGQLLKLKEKVAWICTKAPLVLTSAVLGFFYYTMLLNPIYHGSTAVFLAFLILGTSAFLILPFPSTVLYVVVYAATSMNFFGESTAVILLKYFSAGNLNLNLFVLGLLFLVSKPKDYLKGFLVFISPQALSLAVYSLAQWPPFRQYYVNVSDIYHLIFFFAALFLLFGAGFSLWSRSRWPAGVKQTIIWGLLMLGLPLMLPSLQAQAEKSREVLLGQHENFLRQAQNAETDPGLVSGALIWYDKAAEAGNPTALYKSANLRLKGDTQFALTSEDIRLAMKRLYQVSLLGHKKAIEDLVEYESRGLGQSWLDQLRKIASPFGPDETARHFAAIYLGRLCAFDLALSDFSGLTNEESLAFWEKGRQRFQSAADSPISGEARVYLALMDIYEGNDQKGFEALHLEADGNNNPEAMYALGRFYITGEGGRREIEKGMSYLKLAAQFNNEDAALLRASLILDSPDSSEDDLSEAIMVLKRLNDSYHPGARIMLALRYIEGNGLEADPERGLNILFRLSSNGDVPQDDPYMSYPEEGWDFGPNLVGRDVVLANYNLGYLYYRGGPVARNIEMSRYYLQKPTQVRHIDSINLLAKITAAER